MNDAEWLTIPETADYLKVSTQTVRRYITAGTIKARRIGPRLIRVQAYSLRAIGRSLQYIDPNE